MASCVVCGGTEFYTEFGLYYCTECQTQTQELADRRFNDDYNDTDAAHHDETDQVQTKKTSSRSRKKVSAAKKDEDRITSWECYNYILIGLVNELIELGAADSLRSVIEVLWMKYLKTVEVIRDDNLPPKLTALNFERDAEIIYGRKGLRKRPRSRSSSCSSKSNATTSVSGSEKQARTKSKRDFTKHDYETNVANTTQDTSLINQSLTSLKSQESTEKDSNKILVYNKQARKTLQTRMKKKHLKRHCEDVRSAMDCHQKITKSMMPKSYYNHPSVITRGKLFSLIHLGLLINKDKLQLSDVLRFVKEGHLAFQHVDHFFPEEVIEKKLHASNFNMGNAYLAHSNVRMHGAKMAKLLNIHKYVPLHNIINLCQRYCKELNLPDVLRDLVFKIILNSSPKMNFTKKHNYVPNYEGRAMAFIVFTLKLLFGLDDQTEYEISEQISVINTIMEHCDEPYKKTFNFARWLLFIEYRKLVLTKFNFTAGYNDDCLGETKEFIKFLNSYNELFHLNKDLNTDMEVFKGVVKKIKCFGDFPTGLQFHPSLTPNVDNVEVILTENLTNGAVIVDLLQLNFSGCSLEYLFYPENYVKNIFPDCKIVYKHGGKNDNVKLMHLFDPPTRRVQLSRDKQELINVTILDEIHGCRKKISNDTSCGKFDFLKIKTDSKEVIETYKKVNEKLFNKKIQKRNKIVNKKVFNYNVKQEFNRFKEWTVYDPSDMFCVNVQDVREYTEQNFDELFNTYPFSFKTLLNECARIIEQPVREVYEEYVVVETYLSFVMDIKKGEKYNEKFVNTFVNKNIKNVSNNW